MIRTGIRLVPCFPLLRVYNPEQKHPEVYNFRSCEAAINSMFQICVFQPQVSYKLTYVSLPGYKPERMRLKETLLVGGDSGRRGFVIPDK